MPNEDCGEPLRLVLVGNSQSRRVASFLDTARHVGGIDVSLVDYAELVTGRIPSLPGPCVVRIESPGECTQTIQGILKAGITPLEARLGKPLSATEIERLPCARGEMVPARQWYLGYRHLLERLDESWSPGDVNWMSTPAAIAKTFDKVACLDGWSAAGLPTPPRYHGITTYDELRTAIPDRHARVFVKLRYGYSAAGAVALEWRGALERAITTVETEWSNGRPRMFVTKKPQVLHRERDIAWLIDTLGAEEIVVEAWLPKARLDGRPFDLRIVTIGGVPWHVVGRASASPFTNLNLDARRIDRERIAARLGSAWSDLNLLALKSAAILPEAGTLGLDVLVRASGREFALLEANAFGDYLPGLLMAGMSTYEAELRLLLAREEVLA